MVWIFGMWIDMILWYSVLMYDVDVNGVYVNGYGCFGYYVVIIGWYFILGCIGMMMNVFIIYRESILVMFFMWCGMIKFG